jgi:hypothetical protein
MTSSASSGQRTGSPVMAVLPMVSESQLAELLGAEHPGRRLGDPGLGQRAQAGANRNSPRRRIPSRSVRVSGGGGS